MFKYIYFVANYVVITICVVVINTSMVQFEP